jgi:hypothetical protein
VPFVIVIGRERLEPAVPPYGPPAVFRLSPAGAVRSSATDAEELRYSIPPRPPLIAAARPPSFQSKSRWRIPFPGSVGSRASLLLSLAGGLIVFIPLLLCISNKSALLSRGVVMSYIT